MHIEKARRERERKRVCERGRISAVFDLQFSLVLSTERTCERFVSHSSGGCLNRSNLAASKVGRVVPLLFRCLFSLSSNTSKASHSFIQRRIQLSFTSLSLSFSSRALHRGKDSCAHRESQVASENRSQSYSCVHLAIKPQSASVIGSCSWSKR